MRQLILRLAALLLMAAPVAAQAVDPLPSWQATAPRAAITAFVTKVTTRGPNFVPPPERIAVFDNDGTLWPENPVPFQLAYALDELRRRAPDEPALAADPMVKAALAGDTATLLAGAHHDGLMRILALTHAGMTTEAFSNSVAAWLKTAKHPKFGRRYDSLGYRPMLELLA